MQNANRRASREGDRLLIFINVELSYFGSSFSLIITGSLLTTCCAGPLQRIRPSPNLLAASPPRMDSLGELCTHLLVCCGLLIESAVIREAVAWSLSAAELPLTLAG